MPAQRIPRPVRAARNAAYRIAATLTGVEAIRAELGQASARVADLERSMGELAANLERLLAGAEHNRQELHGALEHNRRETIEIMQLLRDDEPETRRRLWALRETESYMRAYDEAEPLVTVVIPTYTNTKLLIERSLPAVLAQTYENLEVIVVGDGAGPEVEEAVRGVADARIRYVNLTHRGPYPEDPELRWRVAGGPAANEGMRLARGHWIAQLDDDDACTPDHVELLLKAARGRQLEFCYGRIREHLPDGTIELLCEFPPRIGSVSLTCSIMHAGLSFIASELGDALFGHVGDWARVRRMLRVGVRIGMIEDFVLDYYPNRRWNDT
jgi:hypothetical protein